MQLSQILEESGLSRVEANVYLAALELAPALHKQLAEKAGVKRPTLYDLLPGMLEKGLITETIKGKRKLLVAQDIQSYLENKKAQLERVELVLPELRALLSTATIKPTILVYEGIEGIKKVWYDHLAQKQEVLEVIGIENIHP